MSWNIEEYQPRPQRDLTDIMKENKNKTHCPRGHEYDRTTSKGWRYCSVCKREQAKERRGTKRADK